MVSNWMKENVIDKGIENVRVFAKMGKITTAVPCFGIALVNGNINEETWVECKIDETRYKVADGYKITLVALDERFTYDHYYQSDFESMAKSGINIILKSNITDHIEHIKWAEPLYSNVYVVHEADVVVQ